MTFSFDLQNEDGTKWTCTEARKKKTPLNMLPLYCVRECRVKPDLWVEITITREMAHPEGLEGLRGILESVYRFKLQEREQRGEE